MTRDQLEHAIRAARNFSDDSELWVFGSQAVLATDPNPPADLVASIEVDVQPINRPEAVDKIDGTLGEMSPFHELHGFYVQGVLMNDLVMLPDGWKERTIRVDDPMSGGKKTGYC